MTFLELFESSSPSFELNSPLFDNPNQMNLFERVSPKLETIHSN